MAATDRTPPAERSASPTESGKRAFLTARWETLAMLNYEVSPALLRSAVPAGTELDAWNGRVFMSLVGFRFLATRVLGAPIPLHRNFDEVNLRFYVRRRVGAGWRRGTVFIRELVPRRMVTLVARLTYNEPYCTLPMRHDIERLAPPAASPGRVEYAWRMPRRWNRLAVVAGARAFPVQEGSVEEFITEHYWGYTRQRDGGTIEYQVRHPRWSVWATTSAMLDCDADELYGAALAEPLSGSPASAFVADGSAVELLRPVRIAP